MARSQTEFKNYPGFLVDTAKSKATWTGVSIKSFLLATITILGFLFGYNISISGSMGFFVYFILIVVQIGLFVSIIKSVSQGTIPSGLPIKTMLLAFIEGMFLVYTINYFAYYLALYADAAAITPLIQIALLITMLLVGIAIIWSSFVRFNKIIVATFTLFILTMAALSLVGLLMAMFGSTGMLTSISMFYMSSSPLGIAISLAMILFATYITALFFQQARQYIETGVNGQAEWFIALRIIFLVIWIFVEVLRLLVKLAAANR